LGHTKRGKWATIFRIVLQTVWNIGVFSKKKHRGSGAVQVTKANQREEREQRGRRRGKGGGEERRRRA
jgi:hypothetical protein